MTRIDFMRMMTNFNKLITMVAEACRSESDPIKEQLMQADYQRLFNFKVMLVEKFLNGVVKDKAAVSERFGLYKSDGFVIDREKLGQNLLNDPNAPDCSSEIFSIVPTELRSDAETLFDSFAEKINQYKTLTQLLSEAEPVGAAKFAPLYDHLEKQGSLDEADRARFLKMLERIDEILAIDAPYLISARDSFSSALKNGKKKYLDRELRHVIDEIEGARKIFDIDTDNALILNDDSVRSNVIEAHEIMADCSTTEETRQLVSALLDAFPEDLIPEDPSLFAAPPYVFSALIRSPIKVKLEKYAQTLTRDASLRKAKYTNAKMNLFEKANRISDKQTRAEAIDAIGENLADAADALDGLDNDEKLRIYEEIEEGVEVLSDHKDMLDAYYDLVKEKVAGVSTYLLPVEFIDIVSKDVHPDYKVSIGANSTLNAIGAIKAFLVQTGMDKDRFLESPIETALEYVNKYKGLSATDMGYSLLTEDVPPVKLASTAVSALLSMERNGEKAIHNEFTKRVFERFAADAVKSEISFNKIQKTLVESTAAMDKYITDLVLLGDEFDYTLGEEVYLPESLRRLSLQQPDTAPMLAKGQLDISTVSERLMALAARLHENEHGERRSAALASVSRVATRLLKATKKISPFERAYLSLAASNPAAYAKFSQELAAERRDGRLITRLAKSLQNAPETNLSRKEDMVDAIFLSSRESFPLSDIAARLTNDSLLSDMKATITSDEFDIDKALFNFECAMKLIIKDSDSIATYKSAVVDAARRTAARIVMAKDLDLNTKSGKAFYKIATDPVSYFKKMIPGFERNVDARKMSDSELGIKDAKSMAKQLKQNVKTFDKETAAYNKTVNAALAKIEKLDKLLAKSDSPETSMQLRNERSEIVESIGRAQSAELERLGEAQDAGIISATYFKERSANVLAFKHNEKSARLIGGITDKDAFIANLKAKGLDDGAALARYKTLSNKEAKYATVLAGEKSMGFDRDALFRAERQSAQRAQRENEITPEPAVEVTSKPLEGEKLDLAKFFERKSVEITSEAPEPAAEVSLDAKRKEEKDIIV